MDCKQKITEKGNFDHSVGNRRIATVSLSGQGFRRLHHDRPHGAFQLTEPTGDTRFRISQNRKNGPILSVFVIGQLQTIRGAGIDTDIAGDTLVVIDLGLVPRLLAPNPFNISMKGVPDRFLRANSPAGTTFDT